MHISENQLRLIVGNQPAFGNAKYIGRACIASLDGGTKLKAEFVTCGTADHYEAIKLTAINSSDGEIDRLLLRFEDYFKKHTIGASQVTPYIWTYTASHNGIASQPSRKKLLLAMLYRIMRNYSNSRTK